MKADLFLGEFFLTSYDPAGPVPAERVEALFGRGSASVVFYRATGTYTVYKLDDVPPYTYSEGTLSVRQFALRSPNGAIVTLADGTLAYRTTALPAGIRTLAGRSPFLFRNPEPGRTGTIRYIFEDAGLFRVEDDDSLSGSTTSTVGTWNAAGSQLTLTAPQRAGPAQTSEYTVSGGTLRLSYAVSPCGPQGDERCLISTGRRFGLKDLSVTAVEEVYVETFVRTPVPR